MWMLWMTMALATAGDNPQWYQWDVEPGAVRSESDRVELIRAIDPALRDNVLTGVKVVSGGAETTLWPGGPDIAGWDLPVLVFLEELIREEAPPGERDRIVRGKKGGQLVTGWSTGGGAWTVEVGGEAPKLPKKLDAAGIAKQYGLKGISEDGASWDAAGLYVVERALSTLSEPERARLGELTVMRRKAPADGARVSAQLVEGDGSYRLEVYDTAVTGAADTFVGSLAKPLPGGSFAILRGLGQWVAWSPLVQLYRDSADAAALQTALAKDVNRLVDEYNALVEQVNAASGDEAEALHAQAKAKQSELEGAEARYAAAEQGNASVGNLQGSASGGGSSQPTAIHQYAAARGAHPGVTLAGTKSDALGFMDAFALFKADPDALKRLHPGLHAWFAGGGHLK